MANKRTAQSRSFDGSFLATNIYLIAKSEQFIQSGRDGSNSQFFLMHSDIPFQNVVLGASFFHVTSEGGQHIKLDCIVVYSRTLLIMQKKFFQASVRSSSHAIPTGERPLPRLYQRVTKLYLAILEWSVGNLQTKGSK